VICNEEDTDGRARVTTDEERVLQTEQSDIVRLSAHDNISNN